MKSQMGVDVLHCSFFNHGVKWGYELKLRPGRFSSGIEHVPTVQKACYGPESVREEMENLAFHRDSIPGPSSPVASRYTGLPHMQNMKYFNVTDSSSLCLKEMNTM